MSRPGLPGGPALRPAKPTQATKNNAGPKRNAEHSRRSIIGNAAKALRETHNEPEGLKRWTRHGSVRTLWKEEAVAETWDYIIHGQGAPMAVHPDHRIP